MNDSDFAAARAALVGARRSARAIAELPAAWRPADLDEAYRLQHAVIEDLGGGNAWKVAGITPEQRQTLGVPRPIASALPKAQVLDAGTGVGELRLADFRAPKIECEIAFELGRDLPPRPGSDYSRDEVTAAVAALRLTIELVDPRWPAGSGTLAEVADAFNNGALVAGARIERWTSLPLTEVGIRLTRTVGGSPATEIALGSARAILEGDPFATVVMLANAQPQPGPGLKAGDIVTTGSCTGAPHVPGPGLYVADYGPLGRVSLRLV